MSFSGLELKKGDDEEVMMKKEGEGVGGVLIKVHEKCEAEGRAFRGTSHEGKMIEIVTTLFRNRAIRYNNDRETRAFERLLLQQARNAFLL